MESLRQQPFHRDNAETFADYEELEDREPVTLYERAFIQSYVQHCRKKAAEVMASETAESLSATCGFERQAFTRAELYVYTLRHIQHHAAQLLLRLRTDAHTDIPWIGSGWGASFAGGGTSGPAERGPLPCASGPPPAAF